MLNFTSDNTSGVNDVIMEAMAAANRHGHFAYGNDALTQRVKKQFCDLFEKEVSVFFTATGTAANALALSAAVPPWGMVLCHREAHVNDDECGAPEFFTHGAKLQGLPGIGGKLAVADVAEYLRRLHVGDKQMPPKLLSISQATECGLVYVPEEIGALAQVCQQHDLALHMDGARFANARVHLGCSPAQMTWKQGVDILSFGGTKNGCLMAEAIVVFNPLLAESLAYRAKRAGQVISKRWMIAAQFEAYLAQDLWLTNARHANRMASLLAEEIAKIDGVRLAWEVQANEVFAIVPLALHEALLTQIAYYEWASSSLVPGECVNPDEIMIRLVASFATTQSEVLQLVERIGSQTGKRVLA